MHRTEGPDFVTVSGKRRYTDVNPATVISKDSMNAIQEEISLAIEATGEALRTTGALDESGAWGQLLSAIRTLAGRGGDLGVVNPLYGFKLGTSGSSGKAVGSADVTITDISGYTSLAAETGGPHVDGLIRLEENSNYSYRYVFISNFSGTRKKIRSANVFDTFAAWVDNGHGCLFYNNGSYWYPVQSTHIITTDNLPEGSTNLYLNGKDTDDLPEGSTNLYLNGKDTDDLPESSTKKYVNKASGTFTIHLTDSGGSSVASGDAYYLVIDGFVQLFFSQLTASVGGAETFHLSSASDAALPAAIQSAFNQSIMVWTLVNLETEYKVRRGLYSNSTHQITFSALGVTSYIEIPACIISWKL